MVRVRYLWVLSLIVSGLACDRSAPRGPGMPTTRPEPPASWQTITVGNAFTFRAPPELRAVPVQGIDSLVAEYQSPTVKVSVDYGWYSDPMDRRDEGFTRRKVVVDGKEARLLTKEDAVAIHFPSVSGKTRLTMLVKLNGAGQSVGETIALSIRFK
jgi:hypothetical protein